MLRSRRTWARVSLACLLLIGALVDARSGVAGPMTQQQPVYYYLALGDSVPVWNGPQSYPYLLLAHYQRELPGLTLNDIAVSGETTTSMLQDGQYAAAINFLEAHRGQVALITIDIGGNDIVGCALTTAGADPNSPCAVQARATIKQNLTTMLDGLHAAAPGVPVIGMNYYDPLLGDWLGGGAFRTLALATEPLLVVLNHELTRLYGGPDETANVQPIFHATNLKKIVPSPWGEIPIAVERACSWLDISCQAGAPEGFGDDPNPAGAVAIATAFERTIDGLAFEGAADQVAIRRSSDPGHCPSTAPVHVAVNSWSPTRSELAPPGASSVRLCGYASLSLHRRLLRSRLIAARRLVSGLVHEFDLLPPFPPGPVACPNDNGAEIAALLAYPNGRRVTISLATAGCAPVTNGNLNRTAAGLGAPHQLGPRLLAQLERLTR